MNTRKIRNLNDAEGKDLDLLAEKGKALPDLVRKKHIYESHKIMLDFAGTLSNRMERSGGFASDNDIFNLKSSMYVCFHLVNMMVYENRILNLYDKQTYSEDDFVVLSNLWKAKRFANND